MPAPADHQMWVERQSAALYGLVSESAVCRATPLARALVRTDRAFVGA